ncbi:fatty acid desaturase [Streptomyces sp. A3M-1-3]|uniref:fatty acid desaturase n=1 Tax=Streptomyces sp. A3M-1-3 TaxID=2962044 RepID=UPI0020B65349|nr:fatty acid desaturase [Streptomyces sp. A3M-1-3]MCP3819178.1 fatty acid desaturase [Streptomyces sp. A3M-1-3]
MTVINPEPLAAHRQVAVAQDPRQSMTALPEILQYPLTIFTGKALPQQKSLGWTPTLHLATATASMVVGVLVSTLGYVLGGAFLLLLLPGWAMTLHGMRNLRMMVYHQCSHRNMYRSRKPDRAIGHAISSLLVIQNFQRYSREHVSDHHATHHMTLQDPTVQAFLVSLGMHPGMTRRQMWHRLLGRLVSPRFHLAFAVSRVRSFSKESARSEKVTALALYGTALAATVVTGTWQALLVVWLVPLVPMFQISNTLRLCVKHTFPEPGLEDRRSRAYFASLTNAIFIGDRVPSAELPAGRRALAWSRWTLRLLFVHAPCRYLVLTGDTVVHDYHHRHPRSTDWSNYIFVRRQDAEEAAAAGDRNRPPYHEVWGLAPAISYVFDSLAAADAEEFDVNRLKSVSKRELFAAFDD